MDRQHFDALAKRIGTKTSRRGAVGVALAAALLRHAPDPGAAKPKPKNKRQRRRQRKQRKHGQERQYPVFTTCHTETAELGPIPGGPYPACRSRYDPDEFVPCDPRFTFHRLQQKCHDAYPACEGACGILSEPVVGVGDCPDLKFCNYYSFENGCKSVTVGGIPGGPFGSCWSWVNPFMQCYSCPGHTPDWNGMIALCGQEYPDDAPGGCMFQGQNVCAPSPDYSPILQQCVGARRWEG